MRIQFVDLVLAKVQEQAVDPVMVEQTGMDHKMWAISWEIAIQVEYWLRREDSALSLSGEPGTNVVQLKVNSNKKSPIQSNEEMYSNEVTGIPMSNPKNSIQIVNQQCFLALFN